MLQATGRNSSNNEQKRQLARYFSPSKKSFSNFVSRVYLSFKFLPQRPLSDVFWLSWQKLRSKNFLTSKYRFTQLSRLYRQLKFQNFLIVKNYFQIFKAHYVRRREQRRVHQVPFHFHQNSKTIIGADQKADNTLSLLLKNILIFG